MTGNDAIRQSGGPVWVTWLGVVAIFLGVLFAAHEGTELMRQVVLENATPVDLELPAAACPEDELEEEGLSIAECEQMVENIRSYVVSMPTWFTNAQAWLSWVGTLLAIGSLVCGVALANFRFWAAKIGAVVFTWLTVVDAGHFIVVQQAGPILRAIHLPVTVLWFSIHFTLAIVFHLASRQQPEQVPVDAGPVPYERFEVVVHWFLAVAVFFLFVSSWWMLSLPLPSEDFRYRELPFQLHKNIGIMIAVLMIAMAVIRVRRHQALAVIADETAWMRKLRICGHVSLYVLIFAVCFTGYMSSSYSGWSTTWWWFIDLPNWSQENDALNQLYSDLHLWTCWALLIAMATHIGAALAHALRNDGIVYRILRW